MFVEFLFHDVIMPAKNQGGRAAMFADDLNVFKQFSMNVTNEAVKADMQKTKVETHAWGHRNRVTFDPSKEHIVVIHPLDGEGDSFKLLGCWINVQLQMEEAIDSIVSHVRPKIKALLRTRGLYNHSDMMNQYKSHVWGITEYQNGTIIHASSTALDKLERLQRHYVHELHLTKEVAFLDYNFAPPCLRRDIGILGFLHKRVLGKCHPSVQEFFPPAAPSAYWHDIHSRVISLIILCFRSITLGLFLA